MLFGNDDDSLHKLAQRFRIDSDLRVPTDLFVFTITSAPRKKDILRRSGDVDVMYTGHIYCNRNILPVLYGAFSYYVANYSDQRRYNCVEHSPQSDEGSIEEHIVTPEIDHRAYGSEELAGKLHELTGKLHGANDAQDQDAVRALSEEITGMFNGTNMSAIAKELVADIAGDHPQSTKLAEYYVGTLMAVRGDNFEEAARYRDLIRKLKCETKK
jgi:hypothetical protein